ncbi:hypothetical protein Y10_02410 [Neptunitalea sp. Y10]|uniref:Uncharacterized protein n=2 Tax=Neptunitalea lumnitzerae TaxID=2965509 RepID=A0ABQ5MES0_9FLAO|nr:hypothetical protein Y10_02410 [Neptunitalea sp. Y10]
MAQKEEWKTYKNKKLGYSVMYPKEWKAKGGENGFYCGKESGFGNAEFMIMWSDVTDQDRIDFIFNDADFYQGYDVQRETITINGKEAERIIATKSSNPDLYSEIVILKTPEKWYKFENAGVKDFRFQRFYESFTF